MPEIKPHPHADLYIAWIKDTNTKFQFKNDICDIWRDVVGHPAFHAANEYRLKPAIVPHYYVAYELMSGEKGLSVRRYTSKDAYMSHYTHLRYKWVAVVYDTMIMKVSDE